MSFQTSKMHSMISSLVTGSDVDVLGVDLVFDRDPRQVCACRGARPPRKNGMKR